jgi:NADH dehydrogenase subunit L (EC 1.6.5.3)
MNWIIWLIPAFPLLGFLLNALVVRHERTAGILASVMVGLSFAATIAAMVVLEGAPSGAKRLTWTLWEWIGIADFRVAFGLLFDPLTAVMALLITGVGGLIHVYSIGYMHGDVRPVRFFAFMNLFVFAMLMLVMADNLLLLFLGWEGVGLCSFLLIGHYFDRRSVPPGINPSEAAVKAFVVNRVGDARCWRRCSQSLPTSARYRSTTIRNSVSAATSIRRLLSLAKRLILAHSGSYR